MKHYVIGNPKPEFVIALAGPLGTDLGRLATVIAQELRAYHYHSVDIKVSQLLQEWCSDDIGTMIKSALEDKRINALMNAGDLMRREAKTGAALMPLVASAIRAERQRILLSEDCEKDLQEIELYNHCFIVNSLKHPDEVEVLRRIYGDKFVLISAVTSQERRKKYILSKIAKSYGQNELSQFSGRANFLIKKDRRRDGSDFCQNISGTFHLADFFIRTDDCIEKDTRRLLRVLFGAPDVTPTRNEFIMFEAKANAYRSGDLSRQVGAVITNSELEVVSQGCNEVPVPGGDTYWPDDEESLRDTRDYHEGKDYNSIKKTEIITELLEFLEENELLKSDQSNRGPGDERTASRIVKQLLDGQLKSEFKDLRISNLIEFGRMVHAEMFALMEAARRGLSVENGRLYCTTFPCHMCARHIIAAGIREVVYIEPYPKSMTKELYGDIISFEAEPGTISQSRKSPRPDKVYFQAFHGAAPQIFQRAFDMPKRKDRKGYILPFNEYDVQPKWIPLSKSHLPLECAFASLLSKLRPVNDMTAVVDEEGKEEIEE